MVNHSPSSRERHAEEDRREARLQAAINAGWVIRHDPVRLEYTASREMHTGRTLDALLDQIEVHGG